MHLDKESKVQAFDADRVGGHKMFDADH